MGIEEELAPTTWTNREADERDAAVALAKRLDGRTLAARLSVTTPSLNELALRRLGDAELERKRALKKARNLRYELATKAKRAAALEARAKTRERERLSRVSLEGWERPVLGVKGPLLWGCIP